MLLADITVAVGVSWLILASGAAIPFLEGLVTNDLAPGWLEVLVMAVLSAVGGVITSLISSGGTFKLEQTGYSIALTALIAFAAHYGYNVSGALPALRRKTGSFGIGPKRATLLGHAAPGAEQVMILPGGGRVAGPSWAVAAVTYRGGLVSGPPAAMAVLRWAS